MKVYLHDVGSSYPAAEIAKIPSALLYSARVLASTQPSDVVVLPPGTQHHYPWIVSHYEAIGLPVARTVVFGGHQAVRRYPDRDFSVFFFGQAEHDVRPNQRWYETARRLNSKNGFVQISEQLGVKVPMTICVDVVEEAHGLADTGLIFPVFVKLAVSASGFGVWRCDNVDEFRQLVSTLSAPFQIQAALPEGTEFLNVQYRVSDTGSLVRGAVTAQVLKGNTHAGNRFPTTHDEQRVYAATDVLAQWAANAGIQGVFAFDVAATPDGEFLPIECNPRWNGATYYSHVAEKLLVSNWQALNVTFRACSFDGLELPADLAFNTISGEGVVVVNWGCVGDGKLGILVAGDPAKQAWLIEQFERRYS